MVFSFSVSFEAGVIVGVGVGVGLEVGIGVAMILFELLSTTEQYIYSLSHLQLQLW